MSHWLVEMKAREHVLALRELLVRLDENLAAYTLLSECVPYVLEGDPFIAQALQDQRSMVEHILDPECYEPYYRENHHEKPFEEQYQCTAEEAHERLHRVRFLRRWLEEGRALSPDPTLLDCACNDGWMAKNLQGLATYHGLDLNPHCIERAKGRKVAGAKFQVSFAEHAFARAPLASKRPAERYDVVVAYELVEHVKDPAELLRVMVTCCKPGGSLFVSTPLGAGTGGDLPNWWFVEFKGHVRAYTPRSFAQLLAPYGEVHIEISETVNAGQLMVARVSLPAATVDEIAPAPRERPGARHQEDGPDAGDTVPPRPARNRPRVR